MRFDRERTLVFLLAVGVTSLLFINFCDLVFDCGCQSYWSGADRLCNIHHDKPPHCPWCLYGLWGGGVSYGAIVLAQGLFSFWKRTLSRVHRVLISLLLFPVVGGLMAWLVGWLTGYWSA